MPACAQVLVLHGDVTMLSGVYRLAFLSVLLIFSVGVTPQASPNYYYLLSIIIILLLLLIIIIIIIKYCFLASAIR